MTPPEILSGAGLGLRIPHINQILSSKDDPRIQNIRWFEVLVDNWLVDGGYNRRALTAIAERFPLVFHGVGLSIGGDHPIDYEYLKKIKTLKAETGAVWYSEHLSFSGNQTIRVPDLLPLPFTTETAEYVAKRIVQVQDFLGEQILIENISSYVSASNNEMSEGEFIHYIAKAADCFLLLDLNNAHVNSVNFDTPLASFIDQIPAERVKQIHLAGAEDKGSFLLDAHNHPVAKPVWDLFSTYIAKHGHIPTMIEWDSDLPDFETLMSEREKIEDVYTHDVKKVEMA
ncbi:MAG: hypothetical protein ACI9Y1_003095 [Lentisphaeria bacterium]|jgi:uncharacterized protein (UPF0276 family)